MPPCLTLSIMKYISRVSGAIQGKEYRPLLHIGVVANEKRAFGSPSTTVTNFPVFIRGKKLIKYNEQKPVKNKQANKITNKQTNKQTNEQTEEQTNKQKKEQTIKQTKNK